jgi:hypothetical protein
MRLRLSGHVVKTEEETNVCGRILVGKTFIKNYPLERNGKIILIYILDIRIVKMGGEWKYSGSCSKVGIYIGVVRSCGSAAVV